MLARSTHVWLLSLTGALALGACGDDGSGDPSAGTSGEASTADPTGGGDPSAGASTGLDEPTTGGGGSSGTDAGGSASESDSDGTTGEPSPYDGEPLPHADDGVWTWVDFPGAKCRDGSPTGIGVRYGAGAGVAIYFEGGGACFNTLTCGLNPDSFGAAEFEAFKASGHGGLFDDGNPDNPLADWSFIFVPYCTGDVHAGNRAEATVAGVLGPQQFVGYNNVGQFLDRVVPTFLGKTDHVLVTGQSAGGFGAAFNYDRIAEAFPNDKVTLLDDSGPPMADGYLAPCLQKQWRDAWGLDETIPADCANCFPEDGGGIVNLAQYLGEKWPDQRMGLISSLNDDTIRFFFGFGENDCQSIVPASVPAETFAMGLADLRDDWMDEPAGTWGTFYLSGSQHTWLGGDSYESATSGGVKLIDWVGDLLAGTTANVAP